MSPLTRQMWLDAWAHLSSARQSFGEAKTTDEKERALADMVFLSDTFKAACIAFSGTINFDRIKRDGSDT